MPRPAVPFARRTLARLTAAALSAALAVTTCALLTRTEVVPAAARTSNTNPVTPGNFTGFGFDQCRTPSQRSMDQWLRNSPFLAVGIYISGDSRACRDQPNLTPTWVSTQLARGWRLLAITLGPQASCQPRFPRYGDDVRISPRRNANGAYGAALKQGRDEATKSVGAARALGLVPGSTLWYDLEAFSLSNTRCRDSALTFLSGWTQEVHALGYVSGVYSSAGSGIKALDDARVARPNAFTQPDQVWLARWDSRANLTSSYVRDDGWMPHARVKQYRGGHDETWGGVTINIDSNFMSLGTGSVAAPEAHCGGVRLGFPTYLTLRPRNGDQIADRSQVRALQCLLTEQGVYGGRLHGRYSPGTQRAVNTWQTTHGLTVGPSWNPRAWVTLLSAGSTPVLKVGSVGPDVRRLQRALKATRPSAERQALTVSGVFDGRTAAALGTWQRRQGERVSGVANDRTWRALNAGKR